MKISFLFNENKNSKTEDFENNYVLFLSVYVRRNTGDTPHTESIALQHLKYEDRFRVHVGGSFVLTYRVFEEEKLILFLDIEHHDKVYL